jgi:hypothetical protein
MERSLFSPQEQELLIPDHYLKRIFQFLLSFVPIASQNLVKPHIKGIIGIRGGGIFYNARKFNQLLGRFFDPP